MAIFWVKTNKTKKTPSQHSLTTITRANYTPPPHPPSFLSHSLTSPSPFFLPSLFHPLFDSSSPLSLLLLLLALSSFPFLPLGCRDRDAMVDPKRSCDRLQWAAASRGCDGLHYRPTSLCGTTTGQLHNLCGFFNKDNLSGWWRHPFGSHRTHLDNRGELQPALDAKRLNPKAQTPVSQKLSNPADLQLFFTPTRKGFKSKTNGLTTCLLS